MSGREAELHELDFQAELGNEEEVLVGCVRSIDRQRQLGSKQLLVELDLNMHETHCDIELRTEAGNLVFHVKKQFHAENVTVFDVKLCLKPDYQGLLPRSFEATFYGSDLCRLADYVEKSCEVIVGQATNELDFSEPSLAPGPFVTLGNEFQLQITGGDADDDGDGYLLVLVLINCGTPLGAYFNSYFGFESSATFPDLRVFCGALRGFRVALE